MIVENIIDCYRLPYSPLAPLAPKAGELKVKSVGIYSNMVVLKFEDKEIIVRAESLKKAIDNSTNC